MHSTKKASKTVPDSKHLQSTWVPKMTGGKIAAKWDNSHVPLAVATSQSCTAPRFTVRSFFLLSLHFLSNSLFPDYPVSTTPLGEPLHGTSLLCWLLCSPLGV